MDPIVVIGRDGEIYWTEGFHRFAVASILDVDPVPAYVLCRHERWQRIRDRIRETPAGDRPPELASHLENPDVRSPA